MTLKPGTMLGQYEILDLIGKGGMGEVYRAHDTVLKREVALKVLPTEFARDPDRVARFRREAQLLASLNHPNIAAIYGLGEDGGRHFLAMELVLGETLADRVLREGPVPVDEVLAIGGQVAEALEAAHEKTIIHRDLKPANVKLTPEGKVKVLDFGLAKAFAGDDSDSSYSQAPTLSASPTIPGAILGTPAYMSPEQAKGKKVDRRTDIWALGCVLYELLTGQGAFHRNHPSRANQSRDRKGAGQWKAAVTHEGADAEADTVQDILARVLQAEPDWTLLPPGTPAHLRFLLRRCLQKDAKERFHAAPDVRIVIEEAQSAPTAPSPTASIKAGWRWPLVAALACLIVAAVSGLVVWNLKPPTPRPMTRFTVLPPAGESPVEGDCPTLAVSPDGKYLAYLAGGRLYLRAMDSLESRAIPVAEGQSVNSPFFSPDGQWLGFGTFAKLMKASTSGGAPVTLSGATAICGASWGPQDTLVFSTSTGLSQLAAAGGTPQVLIKIDSQKGERSYAWPELLPGGKAVLFTIRTGSSPDEAQIAAQRLETGERRVLIQGASQPRYLPTGHLVYVVAGTLMAVPFDPEGLEVKGPAVPLLEDGLQSPGGQPQFGISGNGTLAYISWGESVAATSTLVWVDRKGTASPLPAPPRTYVDPRVSPDGQRILVRIENGMRRDLWSYDLARDSLTRLTFDGTNLGAQFTPDGKRIVFRSNRAGSYNLYWKPADGSGTEEQLTNSENSISSGGHISSDGNWLLFTALDPTTGRDIWMLPLQGDTGRAGGEAPKPRPFLKTQSEEAGVGGFSPDGRWVSYVSNESGRYEVYVQPFPEPGGKWQISTQGGTEPAWNSNGRELLYREGAKMMAVDLTTGPGFTAGKPRLLFQSDLELTEGRLGTSYAVHPDGQRFLMLKPSQRAQVTSQINVVLNWFEELKRRVPAP